MIIPPKHFGSEVPTLIIRHRFTIVKTNDDAVVPELLDQIFSYLQCVHLHSCSLGNKQFHAYAIRFLYDDLSFCLYQKSCENLQTAPWLQLKRDHHLFKYIEKLTIYHDNANWEVFTETPNIAGRKFTDCTLYLLRGAKNLKYFMLVNQ